MKIENKKNIVTQKQIDDIMLNSEITVETLYDKSTVVTVKLPNGFILTESSACVDSKNYNKKFGTEICLKKIANKVWELEGYRLQCEQEKSKSGDSKQNKFMLFWIDE